jgi:hypothetical protein
MNWEILFHPEVERWANSLGEKEYEAVIASLDALAIAGPTLGRPFVDHIKRSRYPNMKELRPIGTKLRILFAFDFERKAILLVGGNKQHRWSSWYDSSIPLADKRFSEHQRKGGPKNG